MTLDKTYCASPNCTNGCGRKMTAQEKEQLKELTFRGIVVSKLISQAYFCDIPEEMHNSIKENESPE